MELLLNGESARTECHHVYFNWQRHKWGHEVGRDYSFTTSDTSIFTQAIDNLEHFPRRLAFIHKSDAQGVERGIISSKHIDKEKISKKGVYRVINTAVIVAKPNHPSNTQVLYPVYQQHRILEMPTVV